VSPNTTIVQVGFSLDHSEHTDRLSCLWLLLLIPSPPIHRDRDAFPSPRPELRTSLLLEQVSAPIKSEAVRLL
jgi:hypothetical protein